MNLKRIINILNYNKFITNPRKTIKLFLIIKMPKYITYKIGGIYHGQKKS